MTKPIEKRIPYRNRKLLDLAHRVTSCQFKTDYCIGYQAHGCEPAHSNFSAHGKGVSQKADDDQHVASCHACHQTFDGGLLEGESKELFRVARERTFDLYEQQGWLETINYDRRNRP